MDTIVHDIQKYRVEKPKGNWKYIEVPKSISDQKIENKSSILDVYKMS